jgi:acetyltransferase
VSEPAPPAAPDPSPGRYPAELQRTWHPAGGPPVRIRALHPDDLHLEQAFVAGLSPETLYMRLQYWSSQPSERDLRRLLDLDYHDRLAVGALTGDGPDERLVGVSRYARDDNGTDAECAIVVADDWHGRGLGTELMRSLIEAARARDVRRLHGSTLAENQRILAWARRFGFDMHTEPNSGGMVHVELDLTSLGG